MNKECRPRSLLLCTFILTPGAACVHYTSCSTECSILFIDICNKPICARCTLWGDMQTNTPMCDVSKGTQVFCNRGQLRQRLRSIAHILHSEWPCAASRSHEICSYKSIAAACRTQTPHLESGKLLLLRILAEFFLPSSQAQGWGIHCCCGCLPAETKFRSRKQYGVCDSDVSKPTTIIVSFCGLRESNHTQTVIMPRNRRKGVQSHLTGPCEPICILALDQVSSY